jgi:hypothetical protein
MPSSAKLMTITESQYRADLRDARKAAWFEGWNAGDSDASRQQQSLASSGKPLADDEMSDNPYA